MNRKSIAMISIAIIVAVSAIVISQVSPAVETSQVSPAVETSQVSPAVETSQVSPAVEVQTVSAVEIDKSFILCAIETDGQTIYPDNDIDSLIVGSSNGVFYPESWTFVLINENDLEEVDLDEHDANMEMDTMESPEDVGEEHGHDANMEMDTMESPEDVGEEHGHGGMV